jgi:hypothetical protein
MPPESAGGRPTRTGVVAEHILAQKAPEPHQLCDFPRTSEDTTTYVEDAGVPCKTGGNRKGARSV